nr:ribonuclease H-like domain-containing protein [Tanacetum cinerariifolium]
MSLQKRAHFTAPTGRFKVGESSSVVAARQAGHTLAHTVDYGFIKTMDASIRAAASRSMTAVGVVNDRRHFTQHINNNCFEIVFKTHVTQTCGHESNSCHLDTTRHHLDAADIMVVEVDTANNTCYTAVEHSQAGRRLLAVEHYKPQPYAQTLHDTCASGVVQLVAPTTAEHKLARKNKLKACGNTETKKVQKTLLKQQFENFYGFSFEGLDQIHDRLQKLVSQIEIHEVSLSQEDVNLKFLRSLPSEWKT